MRDYGLGDSNKYVKGPPKVVMAVSEEVCPNCGGTTLFMIEVPVEHPQLRGTKGKGTYIGCAACPYASPMVMMASGE